MVVSINGGTQKVIIQFNGTFHHKPSIGYPHLWKPPYSIIGCMITTFSKHSNPTPSFRILITSQALKEAPWPERAISELWWDPLKKNGEPVWAKIGISQAHTSLFVEASFKKWRSLQIIQAMRCYEIILVFSVVHCSLFQAYYQLGSQCRLCIWGIGSEIKGTELWECHGAHGVMGWR